MNNPHGGKHCKVLNKWQIQFARAVHLSKLYCGYVTLCCLGVMVFSWLNTIWGWDNIFKCIFLNANVWISIKISLKFVPKGPINNIPALVQIMAWRHPGDKPLSAPMMVSLPTHICIARPQWVKTSRSEENDRYFANDRFKHTYFKEKFPISIQIAMNFVPNGSPGPWFNTKMTSHQYRKSHGGDKMILRPSYLHNGISYTGLMPSLYWIGALTVSQHWFR